MVSRPGPRSLSPSRPPISRGPSRSPILPRSLFLSHWLVPTLDREPKGALHTHKRTKTNRHSTALGTPCSPPAPLLVATPCAAGCAPPGNNHVPLAAVATVRSLQTAARSTAKVPGHCGQSTTHSAAAKAGCPGPDCHGPRGCAAAQAYTPCLRFASSLGRLSLQLQGHVRPGCVESQDTAGSSLPHPDVDHPLQARLRVMAYQTAASRVLGTARAC